MPMTSLSTCHLELVVCTVPDNQVSGIEISFSNHMLLHGNYDTSDAQSDALSSVLDSR